MRYQNSIAGLLECRRLSRNLQSVAMYEKLVGPLITDVLRRFAKHAPRPTLVVGTNLATSFAESPSPRLAARLRRYKHAAQGAEIIVIPIGWGPHWVLFTLEREPGQDWVLRFMDNKANWLQKRLATRMMALLSVMFNQNMKSVVDAVQVVEDIPEQPNNYDCGVFVILNAISRIQGTSHSELMFRVHNLQAVRTIIQAQVLLPRDESLPWHFWVACLADTRHYSNHHHYALSRFNLQTEAAACLAKGLEDAKTYEELTSMVASIAEDRAEHKKWVDEVKRCHEASLLRQ